MPYESIAHEKDARPIRLAILAMHPVQYHSPLYSNICSLPAFDGKVLYLDTLGLKGVYDKEFGTKIEWDIPLLDGHAYEFLPNYALNNKSGFGSRINIGLFSALKRGRFDAILIQGYSILSFWIALFSARHLGIKVIWRGEVTLKPGQLVGAVRNFMRDAMVKAFLRRCDAVMYTCSGNKEFLIHHGLCAEQLFPFLCAVDNDFFRTQDDIYRPKKLQTKAELGIPEDNLVVLFCGRLTGRKRPGDVLEAIRRAGPKSFTFLIMGDGPQRDELLSVAKAHEIHTVHLGFVNQSEISRYYSISDIFCLLSEYDPSPKALNEAMNFSNAVIVSEIIGTSRDLVIEGETGFRVPVGGVDTVAGHLKLLKDSELRKRIATAAHKHVARFSFAANASGLEEACRFALNGRAVEGAAGRDSRQETGQLR